MVLCRQFLEQVGVLEHIGHGMGRVAYEYHARFALQHVGTAGEGLVRHVVLHDVHQILARLLGAPGEFIEGDRVPVAHEAHAARGIVDE